MYNPERFEIMILDNPPAPPATPMRSACLVPGCPCKDARIVSHRRATFFAAMARGAGETADRTEPVDPSWAFTWIVPGSSDVEDLEGLAA